MHLDDMSSSSQCPTTQAQPRTGLAGFRSQDAMAAMGAGAMLANEDLEIETWNFYGVQSYVFFFAGGVIWVFP